MIITISGNPGSGKSTVAKILVERLNGVRVYVGGIRRELAREKNMTLLELNEYAKTHFEETDTEVDKRAAENAKELEKEGKTVIVEGRTQFHFLPESKKILITVDQKEGAKRIWKDLQKKELQAERNEDHINSLEDVEESTLKRDQEDAERYLKHYKIDHRKEENYDFVVDSTDIPAVEVADKVMKYLNK